MILLIDNYDSFSYNLFQQAAAIEPEIKVVRNDALTVGEIEGLNPSHIILSPGPGYPKDAGICEEVVSRLGGSIPILGVCLGHQAICEAFGGRIEHAQQLMHGKQSIVEVDTDCLLYTSGHRVRPPQAEDRARGQHEDRQRDGELRQGVCGARGHGGADQIALLPDCLYPSGIVSEKMGKTVGCKIVSLFKYVNCKNTALTHL